MKLFLLTPLGYTYLQRRKNINNQYKRILKEIVMSELEFPLFEDDFLMLRKLIITKDESEVKDIKKYKKFIKKDNPTANLKEFKFELTQACNLDCCHCYLQHRKSETYIDFDIMKILLDECIELEYKDFLFTGGEPTLYKSFDKLFEYFSGKDVNLSLFTNGWWGLEKKFKVNGLEFKNLVEFNRLLLETGFKKLILSIDGIGPDHDKLRKAEGLYEKNINIIKDFTKQGGIIEVQAILTKRNIKYVPEFLRTLNEYGVKKINLGIPERIGNNKLFIIDKEQTKLLKQHGIILESQYKTKPKDVPGKCSHIMKPKTIWIKADYLVTPCCWLYNTEASYGDIINSRIIDILNNIHETPVYKLHKNKGFAKLKKFISNKYFNLNFRTECGPCMIAAQFIGKENSTPQEIEELNKKIAKDLGFHK